MNEVVRAMLMCFSLVGLKQGNLKLRICLRGLIYYNLFLFFCSMMAVFPYAVAKEMQAVN